jgi:hypothetical protein
VVGHVKLYEQARACGIQLANKATPAPAASGLEGARGSGEIGGTRVACDIGVAQGVDGYSLSGRARLSTNGTVAEVGGVDQGRPGGIQLGDKGIVYPFESGLEGARGDPEIGRKSRARDIHVTGGIDCYAIALVVETSAQVSGIG